MLAKTKAREKGSLGNARSSLSPLQDIIWMISVLMSYVNSTVFDKYNKKTFKIKSFTGPSL